MFENLRTVLEGAGMGLDAIVKLTVYLTEMGRLRDYTRIKGEFFTGEQPASTAVGVLLSRLWRLETLPGWSENGAAQSAVFFLPCSRGCADAAAGRPRV